MLYAHPHEGDKGQCKVRYGYVRAPFDWLLETIQCGQKGITAFELPHVVLVHDYATCATGKFRLVKECCML